VKKAISISLVFLFLAAISNLSVATHFCGGKEVASKISLTGKLAGCGMETSENEIPVQGTSFSSHCCDNIVAHYVIISDYSPTYSFLPESYQYNNQILAIPAGISTKSQTDTYPLYSNESPPGALMSTNVDLSCICVFRI